MQDGDGRDPFMLIFGTFFTAVRQLPFALLPHCVISARPFHVGEAAGALKYHTRMTVPPQVEVHGRKS